MRAITTYDQYGGSPAEGFEWHYRNKGGSSLREEVHSLPGDLGEEVHSV